jgi:16S rRNA G966 N2-methylase RsmD
VIVKEFENELYEKLFVIDSNLKRRHLILPQRIKLALIKKPILQEIAKFNESSGGKGVTTVTPLGRVDKQIASDAGTSHNTIHKYEVIKEKASKEDKIKVDSGKKSIDEVYNKIKKEEKKQALLNEKPIIRLPEGCKLLLGDFREKSKEIPDNSISLIFTDPPYGVGSIPLYRDLGVTAQRVLKEGGSLVTYAGQLTLPEVFREIQLSGLTYQWIICVKHAGAHSVCHPRNVFIEWKPLLWFVKGEKANVVEYISDYIQSQPVNKALHEWEQSVIEAEYVIKQLTVENQVVLDLFMGSGTTGIAALKLKRKFIGLEIDEERFNIAKTRLVSKVH